MRAHTHTQTIKIHIYKIKKKAAMTVNAIKRQKNVVCAVGEKDAPYYKARHILDQRSWLFP